MKKKIQNKRGQATLSEYLVVFFLAIGAIIAMSVYIQRALQARIHDTRNYMVEEAAKAGGKFINYEYEPYYAEVQSNVARRQNDSVDLLQGGGTGIFRKTINQMVNSATLSQQAPPKDTE
jgi:hypothetical protein